MGGEEVGTAMTLSKSMDEKGRERGGIGKWRQGTEVRQVFLG